MFCLYFWRILGSLGCSIRKVDLDNEDDRLNFTLQIGLVPWHSIACRVTHVVRTIKIVDPDYIEQLFSTSFSRIENISPM